MSELELAINKIENSLPEHLQKVIKEMNSFNQVIFFIILQFYFKKKNKQEFINKLQD